MSVPEQLMPYVRKVRAKLRDYAELNRLTEGVQHLDEQIYQALLSSVEDWNKTPPLLTEITIATHPYLAMLVLYACAELMDQIICRLEEAHLPVQTVGGVSINTGQTIQLLLQHRRQWLAEYEPKKLQHKAALNLSAALGDRSQSVGSPYSNLT